MRRVWHNRTVETDWGSAMYEGIKQHIRDVKDFPKKGIVFKDITPALADGKCFAEIINIFYDKFKDMHIDKVAAIESRGFLLGAPLAQKLGCGLVLLRKPGKLPYTSYKVSYDLEYGSAELEMHIDSVNKGEKILLIDDVLATGGTTEAACKLIKKTDAEIAACAFLLEISACAGRKRLAQCAPVVTFLEY